ncbi:cytochrome b-c1 complex subunit 8 [Rhodocollybia butyracea]|uniref:Cytochrome b-c1 complex subunit 8 n=1 Tax=Rhodocollybia butyracea TaxID=206335 RepID=A0A9P5QB82_9AGAR|nr:cytochrome b-c1 complex subunit 8 [Rhodocollybia butyracea]
MRPTIARASDMPGPKRAWSVWWGDQGAIRQKGIIQYTLAPQQARAAPRWIRSYIFNFYRRVSGEAIYFTVPFAIGITIRLLRYGIYTWGKSRYEYQNSKAGHIASGAAHH